MRSIFVAPARRVRIMPLAARLLAPLCLVTGYLDLVRGGVTAAPLLLVAGYVVLLPLLILES